MTDLDSDERALADLARNWSGIDADRASCRVVRTIDAEAADQFSLRSDVLDAAAAAIEAGEPLDAQMRGVLDGLIEEAIVSHRRSLASPHFVGDDAARARRTRYVGLLERLQARVRGGEVVDQPALFASDRPGPDRSAEVSAAGPTVESVSWSDGGREL